MAGDNVVDADFEEVKDDKKKSAVTSSCRDGRCMPSPRSRKYDLRRAGCSFCAGLPAPVLGTNRTGDRNMAKRDYYEMLGVPRDRQRAGSQVGIPPARQGLPSRPQSRRQGRRAQVQGAQRGLRGPEGSRRSARPTTSSATPHSKAAGRGQPGGGFGPDFAASMSDIFDDLFGDFMGGRRGGRQRSGRERGADLRYNLEITLSEAFAGKTAQIRVPTSVTCETCAGSGAKAGTKPIACPTCGGHRQGARQPGLLHHRAHLPGLPGPRRDHRRSLPARAPAPAA